MPNLIPRDIHHLWMQPNERSSSKNKLDPRHNINRRTQEDDNDMSQRQRISYAPPLSAYSSERPGAMISTKDSNNTTSTDYNDLIFSDIEHKMRQIRSIRTLGDSYLAPVGIGKTMKTLYEEQEIKKQMDQQYQAEAPTAENLLGEGDNAIEDEDDEDDDEEEGYHVSQEPQHISGAQELQASAQEGTQATEQIDLDDEIPEADDNSYDHIYDQVDGGSEQELEYDDQTAYERQYDQGFMVSEEYQRSEEDVTPRGHRSVNYAREQIRTPENVQVNEPMTVRQNATFSSSFGSFSRNVRDSLNDSTYSGGDVSVNESDLDMVLDNDDE